MELLEKAEKALETELDNLNEWDPSEPEYEECKERISVLTETVQKLEMADTDKAKAKSQSLTDKVKVAVELAGVLIPCSLYIWGTKKGYQFEETGCVTSGTFRQTLGKINPFKKL